MKRILGKLSVASALALSLIAIPFPSAGQTTEPDQTLPLDGSPSGAPTATPPEQPAPPPPPILQPTLFVVRPVSWKLLLPNLLHDQKRIWTFPARLAQGENWIPAAVIVGTTAGLVAFDPIEANFFRRSATFQGFNNVFTGNATVAGTILTPVSLYVIGLVRNDSKMKQTALFAGEAVADAEVLTTVLKDATLRVRPAGFRAQGNLSDSWFDSRGSLLRGDGSFPSGHSIAAFWSPP